MKSSAQLQDILRDEPLDFEGSFERYGDFRCSSDRETVARWERPPYPKNAILTVHRIDKSEAILTLQLDSSRYDVSPNGRYVASNHTVVENEDMGLCVTELEGRPECLTNAYLIDRVSVSDSKEVLMVIGTGDLCYYEDIIHGSLTPFPGYDRIDECHAVAYWTPRMEEPRMLEFLGRYPQWITPEAAERLRALSAHLKREAKEPQ